MPLESHLTAENFLSNEGLLYMVDSALQLQKQCLLMTSILQPVGSCKSSFKYVLTLLCT